MQMDHRTCLAVLFQRFQQSVLPRTRCRNSMADIGVQMPQTTHTFGFILALGWYNMPLEYFYFDICYKSQKSRSSYPWVWHAVHINKKHIYTIYIPYTYWFGVYVYYMVGALPDVPPARTMPPRNWGGSLPSYRGLKLCWSHDPRRTQSLRVQDSWNFSGKSTIVGFVPDVKVQRRVSA